MKILKVIILIFLLILTAYYFWGDDKPQIHRKVEPTKSRIVEPTACHNDDGIEVQCKG